MDDRSREPRRGAPRPDRGVGAGGALRTLPLLLLLAAACASPAPLPDEGVRAPDEEPKAEQTLPRPLLWVPREDALDWDALLEHLDWEGGLKLSLAVSPSALPEGRRDELLRLADEGRLEFVLRIEGDPVLPVLQDLRSGFGGGDEEAAASGPISRLQDAAHALALARQGYRDYFGRDPVGVAPAGGALPGEFLPLLRSLGLRWAAVGDYELARLEPGKAAPAPAPVTYDDEGESEPGPKPSPPPPPAGTLPDAPPPLSEEDSERFGMPASADPWAADGELVLVPFRPVRQFPLDEKLELPEGDGPIVLDESVGQVSTGSLRGIPSPRSGLLFWNRPRYVTVSEAIEARQSTAALPSPVAGFAPWTPGLAPWTAFPAQRRAWRLLAEAAQALERYRDSGRAKVSTLDRASTWLRKAEEGRLLLDLGLLRGEGQAGWSDHQFREALKKAYELLGRPAPESLDSPLVGGTEEGFEDPALKVRRFMDVEENRFTAADPLEDSAAPAGRASADPWDLDGFSVAWDDEAVSFRIRMAGLPGPEDPPPLVDVYADLNGRVGSGAASLLDGRKGYLLAEDAWEYALAVTPSSAALYKPGPRGPVKAADLEVFRDFGSPELLVRAPRSLMKGHPGRWGYLVLVSAWDAAKELPLAGPDGATTLDVLESQRTPADANRVLGAVRPAEYRSAP